MINIYIKPRGGFGKEKLHRKVCGIEWSYDLIPYLADIDHKKYSIIVPDFDEYCTEWCPCCDTEVSIPSFGVSFCPNCGELIIPCSMCNPDYHDCRECPYEKWVK